MDSAKIFALGLAAGLAIHVFVRNSGKTAQKEVGHKDTKAQPSIASKSAKSKNKKKNKAKDAPAPASAVEEKKVEATPAPASAPIAAKEEVEPAPVATSSSKKNKKKASKQAASAAAAGDSYAEVASEPPAINNETIRAKADAAQTAFTASLGDMRDTEVDPLPSGYNSVARIPAPEVEAPKPRLSKKDVDDGWSSVGGHFSSSSSSAKTNGTSTAPKANGSSAKGYAAIASTNPFAALPDDATTSSVRRIPAKPSASKTAANGGWTVAGPAPVKSRPNGASNGVVGASAETKKQRSNANKASAKKAAKEEADRLQAERLANHRRQQAQEQAKQREMANRPAPKSVPGSSKVPTAKASVDLNGRLVWD